MRVLMVAVVLAVFSLGFAQATTCDVDAEACRVTVTLNIAFMGADDGYISRAQSEIQDVWNNAGGQPYTVGECKCEFHVAVNTQKVASCTPQPANAHCIQVTSFAANPPRATNGSTYYGYMYPPGVSTGQGVGGWWSDEMSRPIPGDTSGAHFNDFAHEAGHMMGLEDGDGGIMSDTTRGPTQANIDEIFRDVCKDKKCPDRCCCGDGKVEAGKGEGCDPVANPNGCGAGQSCCPYCCTCGERQCDPEADEYGTKEECEANCKGDETTQVHCVYSYWTGCWVCVYKGTEAMDPQFSASGIRQAPKCDTPVSPERMSTHKPSLVAVGDVSEEIMGQPGISYLFWNEKVNVHVEGMGDYNVVFRDGVVVGAGEGFLPDQTMNMYTDRQTVYEIAYGDTDALTALKRGRVRYEGVGLVEGFKFWFADLMFDWFVPYEGPGKEDITESVLVAGR